MKTTGKYILDDKGNPVEETDLMKWGEWFETAGQKRVVIKTKVGGYEVSTVFLGIDYSFEVEPHTPILYETMFFGKGERTEETYRYATKEEAIEHHSKLVEELTKTL